MEISRKHGSEHSDLICVVACGCTNQHLATKKTGKLKDLNDTMTRSKMNGGRKAYGGAFAERQYQNNYMSALESYYETMDLENDENSLRADLENERLLKEINVDFSLENDSVFSEKEMVEFPLTFNKSVETKIKHIDKLYITIKKKSGSFTSDDFFWLSQINLQVQGISIYVNTSILSSCFINDCNNMDVLTEHNVLRTKIVDNIFVYDGDFKKINIHTLEYSLVKQRKIGPVSIDPNDYIFTISCVYSNEEKTIYDYVVYKNTTFYNRFDFLKDENWLKYLNTKLDEISIGLLCFIKPSRKLDELEDLHINEVCLLLNGKEIWFEGDEVLCTKFFDLNVCIVFFDPQIKSIKQLLRYIDGDIELDSLSTINFKRIDSKKIKFVYEGDYSLDVSVSSFDLST